jgi:nuclear RNA export factor
VKRLDNFTFAGSTLQIQRHEGEPDMQDVADVPENSVTLRLRSVLSRRYYPDIKLLDLSNLRGDAELLNMGMFNNTSRESKFFPALMKICDTIFTSAKEKEEAIVSVSLASNALNSIASVTSLAQTFPSLLNLDLSDNALKSLQGLEGWRWKFRKLDHLILSGNPLETEDPSYQDSILKWYPTLRMLNKIQVRSADEVRDASKIEPSIPVLGASFRDEANIGETFIRHFFPAYDSDRTALVYGYYDAKSTFSLNINVSAPRAAAVVNEKPPSWDHYIKRSRNLVKVTHLPAKMSRLYSGVDNIQQCWVTLPSTLHPDLLNESEKWCIECNSIPGLPDPSGQSLGGVGGLIIVVHGEFSEVDVSTGQTSNKRSFDRTFILGPGSGVGGVRVVCDTLVLRAYGGSDAWRPTAEARSTASVSQAVFPVAIPDGFGVPAPGKPDEQVQKEMVAIELSKSTGMTLEYSGMCLQESGWALEGAMAAFAKVKVRFGNVPPNLAYR